MASRIFINYRRDDSLATAGRLHDRLAVAFGSGNVFMDVDHIPAGVDFHAHLETQIARCDVVLVIIGPRWLNIRDEHGTRRLDDPDDFVGLEIAAALARNVRVIPVLIDGAHIPRASELPETLRPLTRRNAVELRNTQFGSDVQRLIEKVREASPRTFPRPKRLWPAMVLVLALLATGQLLFGVPLLWILHYFETPPPETIRAVTRSQPPAAISPTYPGRKAISRIRLRQAVVVRASDVDWYWIETDPRTNQEAQFNFREIEASERELMLYDASRQMYARLNFTDRRAYWRIGNSGEWKWNYDILAVE